MDTYVNDLTVLMEALGLKDAVVDGSSVAQGVRKASCIWFMQLEIKVDSNCNTVLSETDQTRNPTWFHAPTSSVQGDEDRIAPINAMAPFAMSALHERVDVFSSWSADEKLALNFGNCGGGRSAV